MTDNQKVYEAFHKAMAEITHVGKDGVNHQQKFNFRGIDGVMNAVGPIFRKHGLFIIPEVINREVDHATSRSGSRMTIVTVEVKYSVAHADGSSFAGTVVGEANDSADKATAKAMSVALRTFLLQSLVLPTHQPDPDESYEELQSLDYQSMDFQTATRDELLQAMKQAKAAGDEEAFARIREMGQKRFS